MSDDEGGSNSKIAADRVVPVLESLAEDDGCKAVVLAVTSPGGSALASDLIARAIRKLMEKRPVVAWFGDVSASGGYYISAPATEIVANPGSITGSIGVVGGKIVIGDAIARAGIHHETIAAGPDTTMMGPWDGFTEDQRERFRASLIRVYERFIQVVSAGRKIPERSVLDVAEGRVWTGQQALERGLVDHLGGLDLALERARKLAGMQLPQRVDHIRFMPSRLRALSSLRRDTLAGPASVLERLWKTSTAVLFSAVWHHPMEPLMVLPWELWERSD
jgi:protease-4